MWKDLLCFFLTVNIIFHIYYGNLDLFNAFYYKLSKYKQTICCASISIY